MMPIALSLNNSNLSTQITSLFLKTNVAYVELSPSRLTDFSEPTVVLTTIDVLRNLPQKDFPSNCEFIAICSPEEIPTELPNRTDILTTPIYPAELQLRIQAAVRRAGRIEKELLQLLTIMNTIPEPVYVSDLDTHDILFVNRAIRENEFAPEHPEKLKCHELFYNSPTPCEFCTNDIIRNQREPHQWEKKNPITGRYYQVTDQQITWTDGRPVRFCIGIDITEQHQVNEILREDLTISRQKLGMASLHNINKNELLGKLKDRLDTYKETTICEKEISSLLKFIDKNIKIDEQWDKFKIHFDEIHTGFFTRLKEKFPTLTPKEKKLCAYYRVNLSNKDIATLLNIAPDSVKRNRHRLRKKMALHENQNIVSYLESL